MAKWCDYSEGTHNHYSCGLNGKSIPNDYAYNFCKNNTYNHNGTERCKIYYGYYISTVAGMVLKKDYNDSVQDSIRSLKNDYLEKDEKYSDLLSMYDYIGPQIAKKIDEDPNRVEVSTKVYKILARISKLVEKEEIDKATGYYSQMVGVLINKYDLGEFYEETNEKIELAEKTVKKHKIGPKTLD